MSTTERWDWSLIRKRCAAEALRLVRERQDAEEVVQEALIRAWRSRQRCRTPETPLPWCLKITRNEALRLLARRRARRTEGLSGSWEISDAMSSAEPDRLLARIDLDRALSSLPAEDRRLIDLRYRQDFSHPQIAARLQIPEVTARVRLHRAQKQLKLSLGDHV
jgi:RNA polymerase sigma-70 factor (ECF subfamily)